MDTDENKRYILEELTEEQFVELVEQYNLTRFNDAPGSCSLSYCRLLQDRDGPPPIKLSYACMLKLRDTGEFLGWGCVWGLNRHDSDLREAHMYIHPTHRRLGYGTVMATYLRTVEARCSFVPWDARSRSFFAFFRDIHRADIGVASSWALRRNKNSLVQLRA